MSIELDTNSEPTIVEDNISKGRTDWVVNGIDSDASTAVEVKPAPGANNHLYIKKIIMQCETVAVDPQIQDNATSPQVLFGPFYSTTSGVPVVMDYGKYALRVAANQAIDLKAAGAGDVFVQITGFTAEG